MVAMTNSTFGARRRSRGWSRDQPRRGREHDTEYSVHPTLRYVSQTHPPRGFDGGLLASGAWLRVPSAFENIERELNPIPNLRAWIYSAAP